MPHLIISSYFNLELEEYLWHWSPICACLLTQFDCWFLWWPVVKYFQPVAPKWKLGGSYLRILITLLVQDAISYPLVNARIVTAPSAHSSGGRGLVMETFTSNRWREWRILAFTTRNWFSLVASWHIRWETTLVGRSVCSTLAHRGRYWVTTGFLPTQRITATGFSCWCRERVSTFTTTV